MLIRMVISGSILQKFWSAVGIAVILAGAGYFFLFDTDDSVSDRADFLGTRETGGERADAPAQTAVDTQDAMELNIETLRKGSGAAATPGDTVVVHYVGKFLDGRIFDSSVDRGEPFPFRLGAGMVIPGWDRGLVGMKVGERRRLIIPAALAYRDHGAGDVIPPGATLVFEVEMLAVNP